MGGMSKNTLTSQARGNRLEPKGNRWGVPSPDENLISVLRAKYLRISLLIVRTRSFFTLLYVRGTYARLLYNWYRNIFRVIAVLIVFLAVNG